jgi:hypothetical protein
MFAAVLFAADYRKAGPAVTGVAVIAGPRRHLVRARPRARPMIRVLRFEGPNAAVPKVVNAAVP